MARFFCSLDTRDTLERRLVVNIGTCVNVEQAIAENINPGMSHEGRVKLAKQDNSDYIETLWFRLYNPDVQFTISVESGDIMFGDGTKFVNDTKYVDVPNHEIDYNVSNIEESISIMHWNKYRNISFAQNRWRVNNTDHDPERYKRSRINTHVKHTCVYMGALSFATCSRTCHYSICCGFPKSVWKNWVGANVRQSDDNVREHLKHVVD